MGGQAALEGRTIEKQTIGVATKRTRSFILPPSIPKAMTVFSGTRSEGDIYQQTTTPAHKTRENLSSHLLLLLPLGHNVNTLPRWASQIRGSSPPLLTTEQRSAIILAVFFALMCLFRDRYQHMIARSARGSLSHLKRSAANLTCIQHHVFFLLIRRASLASRACRFTCAEEFISHSCLHILAVVRCPSRHFGTVI